MTRRFWAGLMVVALALGAGSAYVILGKVAATPPPPPVHPKKVFPPKVEAPVAVSTSAAAVSVSSDAMKPAASAEQKKPAAADAAHKKRNILFKITRPTAKEVLIVGDFNKWTPKAMKKNGKVWQFSVELGAGRYEYAFVVDGKRIRDPNNTKTNSTGKSSVLTVKPLAAHP